MACEIIKELNDFTGKACLVKKGDEFYVVSSTFAPFTGFETLVFPANETGSVVDWCEVAGGPGMNREEAIAELDERPDTFEGTVIEERPQLGPGE